MSFTLGKIVPWGRSYGEYIAMFALTRADLGLKILGCADGPAAFNAALARKGGQVRSVDPLYGFPGRDIRKRIEETFEDVIEQTRENRHEFQWTHIQSVEELGRLRMAAMEEFLSDYPRGMGQGRYVEGELPHLPFSDHEFDIAVCSHLLFLYSEQLSEQFHLSSIRELCRVAGEARIFPLLELGAVTSRHLKTVTDCLAREGYAVDTIPVSYEFQIGANQMMRIRSKRI